MIPIVELRLVDIGAIYSTFEFQKPLGVGNIRLSGGLATAGCTKRSPMEGKEVPRMPIFLNLVRCQGATRVIRCRLFVTKQIKKDRGLRVSAIVVVCPRRSVVTIGDASFVDVPTVKGGGFSNYFIDLFTLDPALLGKDKAE